MNHMLFITVAYGISAVVIVGLVTWLLVDQAARKHELADLEKRGIKRRSAKGAA